MSESKSKKSPPPSKLSTPLTTATRRGMSDDIHSDRLLAYKPIVTPKVKPGPVRLNTKGKPPSGRNVGKLADLLKMPIDVFCEVRNWGLGLYMANSCGADRFVSSSVGHPSTCSRVSEGSHHFNVEKLGPCLGHREAGDWYARMPA